MQTPVVTEITRGTDHPMDPNAGTGEMIANMVDPSIDTREGEELLLNVSQYA